MKFKCREEQTCRLCEYWGGPEWDCSGACEFKAKRQAKSNKCIDVFTYIDHKCDEE